MTGSESSSTPSIDSFGAAFDNLTESAGRAFENAGKFVSGTYSAEDAAADLTFYTAQARGWINELVKCWGLADELGTTKASSDEFPSRNPGITVDFHRSFTAPVTLVAESFRAIGWGTSYQIKPSDVIFRNTVLQPGSSSVEITVDTTALPREACLRTLVFEGRVTNAQTRQPLGETIRFIRPADPHGARG